MNANESFKVNHNSLKPGVYGVKPHFEFLNTYDFRIYAPNCGRYLTVSEAHSIEHIIAVYCKSFSEFRDEFISINMGACMTMMYVEVIRKHKCNVVHEIIKAIKWAMTLNHVPGARKAECGNYRSHNLKGAKEVLLDYLKVLEHISADDIDNIERVATTF